LLNVPPVACLNLHASLLPRWRGAAPISATIAAGETETGITVMFMDEGLDTGDILLRKMIPIRRRETAGTLHDRLAALAPEALREALELLGQHCAPRAPQNDALATHAPKLSREDGRIEWSSPAVVIERKIRALNPWPSAHTTIKLREEQPQVLKIFSAIVSRKKSGKPGAVLSTDKSGILVACGEGSVLLCDLQLEGRRRMSAREFLLGHPLPEGLVFS
jgi:methionyl-tRNA formyltransferase